MATSNLTVEIARSRSQGLTALFLLDIAEALDLTPAEAEKYRDYAEVVAAGLYVSGKTNRMAHVGALVYIASQLP